MVSDKFWNKACRQRDTYVRRVGLVAADSGVAAVQINWCLWNCQIAKVVEFVVDLVVAADWYFQMRRQKSKSRAEWLLEYQKSRVYWLCSL